MTKYMICNSDSSKKAVDNHEKKINLEREWDFDDFEFKDADTGSKSLQWAWQAAVL